MAAFCAKVPIRLVRWRDLARWRDAQAGAASAPCGSHPRGWRRAPGAAAAPRPSPDIQAGDGAADDQPLDFGGPLENREDLRVPVPALHGELAGVAVTAEDLDRLLGYPHRH